MTKRLIARLDIKGDNVVRGIHLEGLRVVGRPDEMIKEYCAQGIDELIFIDTVATLYGRNNTLPVVERAAQHAFIPLTVGGGIRSTKDVEDILRVGADKITLNSAAVKNPSIITEIAKEFGTQCVVSAIEAKQVGPQKWTVLIENGRQATGLDTVHWAKQCADLGAGEILITSIDRDGTKKGYDLDLISQVVSQVSIPVIVSGGPGKPEHIVQGLQDGLADAAAIGSMLHFRLASVLDIKECMTHAGLFVRNKSNINLTF